MWGRLNSTVFKRTSTFLVVVAGGAFVFERTLDIGAQAIFESINKGVSIFLLCNYYYFSFDLKFL